MYLVGLTGGTGSGKTTVGRMLSQRGAVLIDADEIAREVVEPGTPGFQAVVERFGSEVVAADGSLDRERLAAIVFDDERARSDLNAIVHPRVRARIAGRVAELHDTDGIVVVDVPLLVETGQADAYRAVIVVTAPEETRVARLVRERGMEADQVRARIAAQANDEERLEVATHVIRNDGDLGELEQQVDEVFADLAAAARTAGP
ncbi:MAG TPA: dephospho-CoA kinase [Nitriliruptorales bacterium]|nr:dephospho-CoA kinase [Nitriliruptorales bacterium]